MRHLFLRFNEGKLNIPHIEALNNKTAMTFKNLEHFKPEKP